MVITLVFAVGFVLLELGVIVTLIAFAYVLFRKLQKSDRMPDIQEVCAGGSNR